MLGAEVDTIDVLEHHRSPIKYREAVTSAPDPRHERYRQIHAERDYCRPRRRFLPANEHVRAGAEQTTKLDCRQRVGDLVGISVGLDMRHLGQMHRIPFEIEANTIPGIERPVKQQCADPRKSAQPDRVCKSSSSWPGS